MPGTWFKLLVILVLFTCLIEAAKKKKSKSKKAKAKVEEDKPKRYISPKIPKDQDPDVYCEACFAIIDQMEMALKKEPKAKYRTAIIADKMEKMCEFSSFPSYTYPPPKMQAGCQSLLQLYDEV
eukprot:TRINITY_DN52399_c0_g1_i2.p1 TRINITY_DN52399_c0_g1~~TRINITY_DN52399_c0_g1_i2.p1  ORF type:complete len:124 (+),score=27.01 TRINITY_DN52399_c0_g1_i2:41-412(+)